MTAAEILSRAADLLEARGWEGVFEFWVALGDAAEGTDGYWPAVDLACERTGTGCIGTWAHERTLPQVLAMLRGNDWRNA